MLHDLVPGAAVIGALLNPNFPPAVGQMELLEVASRAINQKIYVLKAGNDTELDAAFASLVEQKVGALLVAADPYFDTRRDRFIAFAEKNDCPPCISFAITPSPAA